MKSPLWLVLTFIAVSADFLGGIRDWVGGARGTADRGQATALGIFGVLVFGAIALVVVSIVLLFGMDIAGEFAEGITGDGDPFTKSNETFTSSGTSNVSYTVNRVPDTGNTVLLNDDETVHNRTSGSELTEGSDYEFFPSNGTVDIFNTANAVSGTEFNITYTGEEHQFAEETAGTVSSTGNAFELFGTSVLVIPAAAVLTVLIGGMVGAVASVQGGNLPGNRRGR